MQLTVEIIRSVVQEEVQREGKNVRQEMRHKFADGRLHNHNERIAKLKRLAQPRP